jgi:hypothetical protein
MTYDDRDLPGGRMTPVEPRRRAEPPQRTTPRQALWSCAVAAAVVFVLAVVFYGINAADHPQTAANPTRAATSADTGISGANTPAAPQTTGQRTSQ